MRHREEIVHFDRTIVRTIRRLGFVVAIAITSTFCGSGVAQEAVSVHMTDQEEFEEAFISAGATDDVKATVIDLSTSGTALEKTGKGDVSYILNSAETEGAEGQALPSTEVLASFRIVGSWQVASLGVWVGVSEDLQRGWLGLINVVSDNEVRLRIFSRSSGPSRSKLDAPLVDETVDLVGSLDAGEFYRARLTLTERDGGVSLTLALLPQYFDDVLAEVSIEDGEAENEGSNQVGVRLAGERLILQTFEVSHPE